MLYLWHVNMAHGAPACSTVFERTLIFGASVSANTMRKILPLNLGFGLTAGVGFGQSPGHILAQKYAKAPVYKNFAAPFAATTGTQQIADMLAHHQSELKQASSIIGVDAFYWDAVRGTCAFGALQQIERLIDFAHREKKVLILGTVPIEDPALVFWMKLPTAIQRYAWHPPEPKCVMQINNFLVKACAGSPSCYLVDLFSLVQELNVCGELKLPDGRRFTLRQIRPDGVHLSELASRLIVEQILEQMALKPPVVP